MYIYVNKQHTKALGLAVKVINKNKFLSKKQVNWPKIPSICLTQWFRIKNINVHSYVIKHYKKIQWDISRDFKEN